MSGGSYEYMAGYIEGYGVTSSEGIQSGFSDEELNIAVLASAWDPWLIRGGQMEEGILSGQFYFHCGSGIEKINHSSRLVLAI